MRYYELEIKDMIKFTLNEKNPYAPRLRFNIQTYSQNNGNAILNDTSLLELFNVDLHWFNETHKYKFINKEITLKAGFKATPLTKNFGYDKDTIGIILKGYVINIIANYNAGSSTQVTFIVSQTKTLTIRDNVSKAIENQNKTKEKSYKIDIKPKGNILAEIIKAFKVLYSQECYIDISNVAGYNFVSQNRVQSVVRDYNDLVNICDMFVIDNKKIEIVRVFNGFLLNMIEIKKGYTQIINKTQYPTFILKPCYFLEQPVYIGTNTIQCSLILNPSLRNNCFMKFQHDMLMNLGNMNISTGSASANYPKSLIGSGLFQIRKVWHIGDSTNTQGQQWATNIEANRIESKGKL